MALTHDQMRHDVNLMKDTIENTKAYIRKINNLIDFHTTTLTKIKAQSEGAVMDKFFASMRTRVFPKLQEARKICQNTEQLMSERSAQIEAIERKYSL